MRRRDLVASTVGVALVLSMIAPPRAAAAGEQAPVGFPAGYPSGASYDAYVATLPGFGILSDTNPKVKGSSFSLLVVGGRHLTSHFSAGVITGVRLCVSVVVVLQTGEKREPS